MGKVHNLRHTGLRHLPKKAEPEAEAEPQSNTMVGTLSTGKVQTDNSFKIRGGSVFSSSGNSALSNNVRVSSNVVAPKMKNRNRETLVRTIF